MTCTTAKLWFPPLIIHFVQWMLMVFQAFYSMISNYDKIGTGQLQSDILSVLSLLTLKQSFATLHSRVMRHKPMGWVRCFSQDTWCRWCSPNEPGTWAEVVEVPCYHRKELSGCPIPTPLPPCHHSADTCLTYTETNKQNHNQYHKYSSEVINIYTPCESSTKW